MKPFFEIAQTNRWEFILPELGLAFLAIVLLVVGMFLPRRESDLVGKITLWGQAFVVGVGLWSYFYLIPSEGTALFGGMLVHSFWGQFMRGFLLLSSILVSYLGSIYLKKQILPHAEFYAISLVATAALMLLVQSHHFVMLFVALETATIGFYVLVSYCRQSSFSLEAGFKYLILSALSSSILLFGVVLLYGVAGNPQLSSSTADAMNFTELGNFIVSNSQNLLVQVGTVLVVAGLAFKIGVVPFQIWIPDVYQGAPTPITSFLAVASKAAGFFVLIHLVIGAFNSMAYLLVPLLSIIAGLSILFGNLAALSQPNVKRLMGLSGIAHAGYILVGVIAAFKVEWAVGAVIFYFLTYLLGSFSVFGVMAHLSGINDENQKLEDYKDLGRERPFLAAILTGGLGSLAGIPPLGGFIAKLLVFIVAFRAELYTLLGIAIIGVVISIFYYFAWIREAVFYIWRSPKEIEFKEEKEQRTWPELGRVHYITLGALVTATILIGVYQGPLAKILFTH